MKSQQTIPILAQPPVFCIDTPGYITPVSNVSACAIDQNAPHSPKKPKGSNGDQGAGTTKLEMVLCQPHQLGHLRIRGLPMDQVVHHQVQTVVVVVAVVVTGVMVPVVIWVDYLHMGLNMLYQFRLDQMSFNSQRNVTYIDLKICVW